MHRVDCPTRPELAGRGIVLRGAVAMPAYCQADPKCNRPSCEFFGSGFCDQEWTDRQEIHSRAAKAVDGFVWRADDGLVFVEAGVQKNGNPGDSVKGGDEIVIQRVFVASYSLQAARIIDMIYRAKQAAFFRADLVDVEHERRWVIVLEIFVLIFGQNRRRKGAEPLAMLDAGVENIFHVG